MGAATRVLLALRAQGHPHHRPERRRARAADAPLPRRTGARARPAAPDPRVRSARGGRSRDRGGPQPEVLRAPYLLYPAQFWSHKNHATLLRALALLPEYTLACVGSDKGYLDHVRGLARELGVLDRVRFLGFVETDELVALYRGAHALVYLSFFGPENLPPLEAFALGCPVVQADVAGAREQLGDAALLVPPTDPRAVADGRPALRGSRRYASG